jgi:hypothetical protein
VPCRGILCKHSWYVNYSLVHLLQYVFTVDDEVLGMILELFVRGMHSQFGLIISSWICSDEHT